LLNGEDLGEASKPWRSIRTNMPKITNEDEAVKYFRKKRKKYGEKFLEELKKHFNDSGCWKRAALIIGHALTMHLKLPDKEEYSDSEVVDVLNPCKIDDYLLVDNKIPIFVEAATMSDMFSYKLIPTFLIEFTSTSIEIKMHDVQKEIDQGQFLIAFTSIFANKYKNAINEAKKLLEIWRKRGSYNFEAY
jgi:hypothetical protein